MPIRCNQCENMTSVGLYVLVHFQQAVIVLIWSPSFYGEKNYRYTETLKVFDSPLGQTMPCSKELDKEKNGTVRQTLLASV